MPQKVHIQTDLFQEPLVPVPKRLQGETYSVSLPKDFGGPGSYFYIQVINGRVSSADRPGHWMTGKRLFKVGAWIAKHKGTLRKLGGDK